MQHSQAHGFMPDTNCKQVQVSCAMKGMSMSAMILDYKRFTSKADEAMVYQLLQESINASPRVD